MEVSSGRAERRAQSARCPKDTQHKPFSAVSAGFPLPRAVACHQELLSTARSNVASDSERVCLIGLLSTEGLNGLPVRPWGCGLEAAISSQQTISTEARKSQSGGQATFAETLILGERTGAGRAGLRALWSAQCRGGGGGLSRAVQSPNPQQAPSVTESFPSEQRAQVKSLCEPPGAARVA